MNLLEVLVPKVDYFYIYVRDNLRVGINKYLRINLDFSQRISYRKGEKETSNLPLVSYFISMTEYQRKCLYQLFKGKENPDLITTVSSILILSEEEYKFPVRITSIPSYLSSGTIKNKILPVYDDMNLIRVEVGLENVEISLQDEIKVVYKKIELEVKEFEEINKSKLLDV